MKDMDLLGYRVEDVVTGCKGVVTSISYDLYGCVQAIVQPDVKDNVVPDSRWFDTKRLKKTHKAPVMPIPTFEVVPGGQALPKYPSMPIR